MGIEGERDLRTLKNIGDLSLFRKFLLLCAGRTGQLLNMAALGNEVGVDHKTIRSWISVLEACFIIFLLRPYHRKWNKRVVKQPKLYFHDTGLLCSLLGIKQVDGLAGHYLHGAIFENYVITEQIKARYNRGERPSVFFWRDHSGHEIDLIVENGTELRAVEQVRDRILAFPESGHPRGGFKITIIRGYPYCVAYPVEEDAVIVEAIAHMHRDVSHWKNISKRK